MPNPQVKVSVVPDRVEIDIHFEPADASRKHPEPAKRIGRLASVVTTILRWIDHILDLIRERL